MVADHALKNSADHARMVRAMEQLSTWLAQATEEGRAALHIFARINHGKERSGRSISPSD